jgi:hypothetical protein
MSRPHAVGFMLRWYDTKHRLRTSLTTQTFARVMSYGAMQSSAATHMQAYSTHFVIVTKHGRGTSQAGKWKKAQVVRLRRTESLSFHANKYEQPKCKQAKPRVRTPLAEVTTSSLKRRSQHQRCCRGTKPIEPPRIIIGRARRTPKKTTLLGHHNRQVGWHEVKMSRSFKTAWGVSILEPARF